MFTNRWNTFVRIQNEAQVPAEDQMLIPQDGFVLLPNLYVNAVAANKIINGTKPAAVLEIKSAM